MHLKVVVFLTGLLSIMLDFLKGAVPVSLAYSRGGLRGEEIIFTAILPVVGHAFSPFLKFKGGKAIATTFGIWSALTTWTVPVVFGAALTICVLFSVESVLAVIIGMICSHLPFSF